MLYADATIAAVDADDLRRRFFTPLFTFFDAADYAVDITTLIR